MLVELRLENFAVIENVAVEFGAGLNLLTGETGAGKSMLIDALALLLGGKASPDVVRFGAERAVVAAVFEVEADAEKAVSKILEDNGMDADDAGLILRREISAKGRVFVNNQPATVALLKQLAPHIASIHAQNESLVSFDAGVRLELLDQFAGTQLEPLQQAFDNGSRSNRALTSYSRASRNGCGWSISGHFKNARSRTRKFNPAKTSAWMPKNGC